jgi:hypothetical protein
MQSRFQPGSQNTITIELIRSDRPVRLEDDRSIDTVEESFYARIPHYAQIRSSQNEISSTSKCPESTGEQRKTVSVGRSIHATSGLETNA